MIYLDYAAHTSIDKKVFEEMLNISKYYPGSVNSDYSIGFDSYNKYTEFTTNIKNLTKLCNYELILNSGATESNNLAIKGCVNSYKAFGKHIITTEYEHSSVIGSINSLIQKGFTVSYVDIDKNGHIDINSLKNLIKNDTILVSIGAVNSETGHVQNLSDIKDTILSVNPNVKFHTDATQSFGKIDIDYSVCDYITTSAHKLFGPTSGCGMLYRKLNALLKPEIDGGKSMSPFRSATPDLVMMSAYNECCNMFFKNLNENFKYVSILSEKLVSYFKMKKFFINSDKKNPYIVNISTMINGDIIKNELSKQNIFFSTKSSCVAKNTVPKSVKTIYKDNNRAKNSIRISLSYKTTIEEIEKFIKTFDTIYEELNGKS